jgi:S-adenosylmethionine hydrolase
VLRIDRFGNVVTNIDRRSFEAVARSAATQVIAGGHVIGRLVATYADIQPGEICALFGSTDHLELAANSESAAERLALGRGAVVEVRRT